VVGDSDPAVLCTVVCVCCRCQARIVQEVVPSHVQSEGSYGTTKGRGMLVPNTEVDCRGHKAPLDHQRVISCKYDMLGWHDRMQCDKTSFSPMKKKSGTSCVMRWLMMMGRGVARPTGLTPLWPNPLRESDTSSGASRMLNHFLPTWERPGNRGTRARRHGQQAFGRGRAGLAGPRAGGVRRLSWVRRGGYKGGPTCTKSKMAGACC
jgi:hypothetical protein